MHRVAGYSDDSVAFDATSGYLLVGRGITSSGSSSILSYGVSSAGILANDTTVTPGQDPYWLLVDATGDYVYSANRGSGTVSGFSIASGTLTAVASSPFAGEAGVTALAEDIKQQVCGGGFDPREPRI